MKVEIPGYPRLGLEISSVSPMVLLFLGLTQFTMNITNEFYTIGIIITALLLGASLTILFYVIEKNGQEYASLGSLSFLTSAGLSMAMDFVSSTIKVTALYIMLNLLMEIIYICFPVFAEIKTSSLLAKIFFGFGVAVVLLGIYVLLKEYTEIIKIVSGSLSLAFLFFIIVYFFMDVPKIVEQPNTRLVNNLPNIFWIVSISYYITECLIGGIRIINKTAGRMEKDLFARGAFISAGLNALFYIILIYMAKWIRFTDEPSKVINLIFGRSSELNKHLNTETFDTYGLTSILLALIITSLIITNFILQLDIVQDTIAFTFKSDKESTYVGVASYFILAGTVLSAVFTDDFSIFFYVMSVTFTLTPLYACYPFVCYMITSKKMSIYTVGCIAAILFLVALIPGDIMKIMELKGDIGHSAGAR